MLCFLSSVAIGQQPDAVYLTWQGDTSKTITVNFLTSQFDARSIVFYDTEPRGGDPASYRFTAGGRSHVLPGVTNGPKVHWVELTGLEPGKPYYFVAGDPDFGVSPERKFRTVPEDGSAIRFITGGDMGVEDAVRQLNRQAAAREPHFALIGGDIAYVNGNPSKYYIWENWMRIWTEEMITPEGFTVPLALAIGNHEVRSHYGGTVEEAPYFFGLFAQNGKRSYFRRQFGPHLVVYFLDTGHIASHESQVPWIEEQMIADQDFPNRFAIYHVPLYPSHRDFAGKRSAIGRRHWEPVFSRYSLTTAFENHDHTFKRSKKILNGETSTDDRGVLYLGDGAWGRGPRPISLKERWYIDKASSTLHFWLVDVSREGVSYRAVDLQGKVFDVYPPKAEEEAPTEAYFQTIEQTYSFQEGALEISPLLTGDKQFRKGTITVNLANKEPYPMEGQISIESPVGLRVKPDSRSVKLLPEESKTLKFSLKSDHAADVETLPAIRMELALDYKTETRILRQKAVRELRVDRLFSAKRSKQAPIIDGNLEEWPNLPNTFAQPAAFAPAELADFWEGPDDASLRFAVAYDQDYIYFAISTLDDLVQTLADQPPEHQDSLFFWIDIYPDGRWDDDPLFAITPGVFGNDISLVLLKPIDGEIQTASIKTETGYNTEISFPLEALRPALKKRDQGQLEYLRLNIAIIDKDRSGQKPLQLLWRPQWEGSGDYSWSGVFKLN